MAQFKHSVRIRMGAAHDDVTVKQQTGDDLYFDRAALSKQRNDGTPAERMDAKQALYGLRKGIVDAFVVMQEHESGKDRRRNRRMRKGHAYA